MIKIIFADDEAVFRRYFRNVIDWESNGYQICGEAKNGMEALELIEQVRPDIAFIDINMPYMSGMDLAAKVKLLYPTTFILLVTGHSEFEYARQAVKIGVDDYILKPFDEEELHMALAKVKGSMEKTQVEKDKTKNEQHVWKEGFLNLLISNAYEQDNETIQSQLKHYQLEEGSLLFQVVAVEINGLHEQWPDSEEIRLRKYIISNLLQDLVQPDGQHFIFNGPENCVISLLHFSGEQDKESFVSYSYERLSELIKKHFGFSVTVGIGSTGQGIPSIRQSYIDAVIALRNKISMNHKDVVDFRDITSRSANVGFYPSEMNEKLLIHLRLHDEEEIKNNLDEILLYIQTKQLSSDYIHMIMAGLVSLCLTYIYEMDKRVDQLLPEGFSPFKEIFNKPSLEAGFTWITDLYLNVARQSKGMKRSKAVKLLNSAREYIDTHYSDNQLKVEDVAKHLYIQSRYLLKVFKQELGISVSDYIFELRMQTAKELLLSGKNLRLTDIAEMVGYSDPGHFSKSFKRNTGLSPSEYEVMHSK
ncbi:MULTISPECIES: response regulator [Paenibacillus]|nr:response regulator [Paenibacillus anaericanus]